MEETKFMRKKIARLEEKDRKDKEFYEKQSQFTKMLEERYKTLCQKVEESEALTLIWGEAGEVTIKKAEVQKEQKVVPREIKVVSEIWKNDTPDNFQVVMNQAHFDKLKGKVRALKKSQKIRLKKHDAKLVKINKKGEELVKDEANFGKPI